MRIFISLNKQNDIDLIAMHHAGVPLGKIFRDALYAFSRGERHRVRIGHCPVIELEDACVKAVKRLKNGEERVCYLPIRITVSVMDERSLVYMSSLRKLYGNAFAKQLIRSSIENPVFLPFFMSSDDVDKEIYKNHSGWRSGFNALATENTVKAIKARENGEAEEAESVTEKTVKDVTPRKPANKKKAEPAHRTETLVRNETPKEEANIVSPVLDDDDDELWSEDAALNAFLGLTKQK